MFIHKHAVDVTTDAGGAATVYSEVLSGKISTIRYVQDGSVPLSDNATVAVTAETTGEAIWSETLANASSAPATRAPRQATHGVTGVASLYAAAGLGVQDKIALHNDRVKIVIGSGGNAKKGRFWVVME